MGDFGRIEVVIEVVGEGRVVHFHGMGVTGDGEGWRGGRGGGEKGHAVVRYREVEECVGVL